MSKTVILTAMAVLVAGDMIEQRASGRSWTDVWLHGATKQWLAVVVLLASLLTVADLGAGGFAALLAVLVTLGYLLAGAGALGPAFLSVVHSTWGN